MRVESGDHALEEVLEAVWKAEEGGAATLEAIRAHCDIEIAEDALAALQNQGLIDRGGETRLTAAGRARARSLLRRHRLAETLFTVVLNLDAKLQDQVACEVEHTLPTELEEGICTLLGHPTSCPHGKPIPPGRCCEARRTMAETVVVRLADLAAGERGRITFIKPRDHARLHRLTSFGLTPGTVVQLHQRSPAFCLRFEGTELAIDRDVAEDIYVARIEG
jgi:DtxR family Mn-dependent transcriptional regulator